MSCEISFGKWFIMNACKIVIFMWDLNWAFKSFGYISVRRMWLVVQSARLSLCLLHLCGKSTLYQLCCAVLFTLYLLTSAIDIVTIAGHHELLQVCVGAGGGDQGVTPSLATHSTAHRVTGELHQLETTVSFSLLSLLWSYWLFTCLRWLFSWVSMETSLFRATISASRGSCNTQMSRGCHVSRRDGVWQWQCATNDTL